MTDLERLENSAVAVVPGGAMVLTAFSDGRCAWLARRASDNEARRGVGESVSLAIDAAKEFIAGKLVEA